MRSKPKKCDFCIEACNESWCSTNDINFTDTVIAVNPCASIAEAGGQFNPLVNRRSPSENFLYDLIRSYGGGILD